MKKSKKIYLAIMCSLPLMSVNSTGFAASELEQLKLDVEKLKTEVAAASEWRSQNSLMHMAGYADVGYVKSDAEGDDGSYNVGNFAPIFHYQYRDLVMLESELEIGTAEDGSTEVAMEYLTIDWIINDNMILVAGKFLSPIGNFRQNLHPSWINKLPSAPTGFGHDGAAPVSELGVQLRGGFQVGGMKANYAVYTGNGPEVKAEIEPDAGNSALVDEIEFDGVEAEGFGADGDGEKVFGGRLGLLPMPSLEIGVSFISGKATVTSFEGDEYTGDTDTFLDGVAASTYDVTGVDVSWRSKQFDVRYEYVKSEVGGTVIDPGAGDYDVEAAEWSVWYAQAAYRFPGTKYEAVVRFNEFDSPHDSADREQTAIGVNYLFSNNFIGKLGFESNDNPNAGFEADDRTLIQLAYGF